jgi:hypothetical protein
MSADSFGARLLSFIGTGLANKFFHSSWLSLVGLDPAAFPADWLPDAFYLIFAESSLIIPAIFPAVLTIWRRPFLASHFLRWV